MKWQWGLRRLGRAVFWGLVGILILGGPAGAQTINVRMGSISPPGSADVQTIEVFIKEVTEATKGRVKVTVFPGSQLGGYKEMLESIKAGGLEGLYESLGDIEPWTPLAGIEAAPYLYRDADHFFRAWRGPVGKEIFDKVAKEAGFRVIGPGFRGFRDVAAKRAIHNINDLKGFKIRVPAVPTYLEVWKVLGSSPTPMAFEEVFTALQQGVVEGVENPITLIYDHKFYEVTKYLILTRHMAETMGFIFSEKYFQGLPTDIREAMIRAANKAADWYRDYTLKNEAGLIKKMQERGTILIANPDLTGFRAKAKQVKLHPAIAEYAAKIRAVK